jgi:hypothetical protein
VPENPAAQAVQVALAVPENPAAQAVQVALVVLENPAVPAARVALENPVVPAAQVALAVLERQLVPELARQQAAVLARQVVAAAKEAQTRSVDISRRGVAAAAPSLAAVGALLKPRAAGVAVA